MKAIGLSAVLCRISVVSRRLIRTCREPICCGCCGHPGTKSAIALFILVRQYQRTAQRRDRQAIYGLYLRHTRHINNWDLVDGSAEHIVGAHLHLYGPDRNRLRRLAASKLVWNRRIAMLATFHRIKLGQFRDALMVAELLLEDDHDLIHKAAGWMLREIGKRDRSVEERFLRKYAARMPRTMLRYAIERFPESLRGAYLRRR